jgi:hypothetical protein
MATAYTILSLPCGVRKRQNPHGVKYWEIIADNLSKADGIATVSQVRCYTNGKHAVAIP